MRASLLLTWTLVGCGTNWELPHDDASAVQVRIEPGGSLAGAPQVARFRVQGASGRSALADFRLFRDELSEYHLGRIRARDLPGTLIEREIPAVIWAEPPDIVVAPAGVLAPGRVSLATPELGLVASIDVSSTPSPALLERFWPPRGTRSGGGLSVFCGEAASLAEPGEALLAPGGVAAEVLAGLDARAAFADSCVRIELTSEATAGTLVLPPLSAGGAVLEPLPLLVEPAAPSPPRCTEGELGVSAACARVDDDRVTLRAPDAPVLFALESPAPLFGVAAPEASLVLRGLEPGQSSNLAGHAFDLGGTDTRLELKIQAAPRRPHLVINEVLANPAGPEASSEWIELVNDGTSELDLSEFQLVDSGGAVSLPQERVGPGEIVLLVGPAFAPDPELDVAPAPGARIIALEALGKAGLSNAGELLRLVAAGGTVVSRWPSLPAPAPGQSLARRAPEAPDGESGSFGEHAAPGASPGAANQIAAIAP